MACSWRKNGCSRVGPARPGGGAGGAPGGGALLSQRNGVGDGGGHGGWEGVGWVDERGAGGASRWSS